jgi:hypothetical protein
MADRYWVAGNAGWNSTSSWSTTSGGASGASVPTSADNAIFDRVASYTVSLSTSAVQCANFTISAGTVTFSSSAGASVNVYGDFSIVAATAMARNTGLNFSGTSGTQRITTNGANLQSYVNFNGSATYQLQDNFLTSDPTYTNNVYLTSGTLDLNNKQLSTPNFNSNNSNVRGIAFGSTGKIILLGQPATTPVTVWDTSTTTNMFTTGTTLVTCANALGTTGLRNFYVGNLPESQAISFSMNGGTFQCGLFVSSGTYKNVSFVGFNGPIASHSNASPTIYGDLTFPTGGSINSTALNGTFVFSGGSDQTITSNGKAFCASVTMDKTGGTLTLADALALETGATARTLTLANGTFNANSKTISSASATTFSSTGTVTLKNLSTALAFTHTSGTLTQGTNNATGAYTISDGTLNLGGFTLTAPTFITATGTKNITFNAGTLAITNATTTAFNNAVPSGFTTTAGTGTGKISMTAATAKTFVGGGSTYNCTLSNDGAGALTISGNNTIDTVTTTSGNVAITGNNTITTITNAVQPITYTFTAGTTQTISNWLVSGISGSLVTIASATASSHTLSKSSGIVSSNYLSISRSTATGGATWYAGANSTNGGNNTGWIFQNAPGGAFFSIF